ncbi:hypothetical protein SAMN05421812_106297 [Asanoa hainanensis]|uniref:Uncharacterized protein n=1 Tax=Asanoa hainanensis TaxID=560556 RepID=A0A239MT37_9ACTN|nr:hypothetical protein [Asanoa hainanensis]SNT45845.1 hypothetical protein SAMN05421812_106297 [Asanoa hainanensis]
MPTAPSASDDASAAPAAAKAVPAARSAAKDEVATDGAAAKAAPASRAAGEDQADVVKDPAPATTKTPAKIPARRKAITADEDQAPTAAPPKAKRVPAKKAAPVVDEHHIEPAAVAEETSGMSIQTPPATIAETEPATTPGGSLRRLPELAAVAAAERLAPKAADWAREIRATYPTATPDGVARLAQRRFTRKATATGATASFANGWSAAADLAGTSWVNAELITHIAAAYGKQATAADILVLTGVHQDHVSAQAAIDGEPGHSASRAPITAAGKTATWAALKILTRWWPGLAAAGGAATASLNSERVAARAIQRFRAS